MSELIPETPETPETPAVPETPETPDRTFTQADLDRIVKDRLARQKSQFEGFDDLKAKAARLDEIEEANKTELQKAVDRATAAEAERDTILTQTRETRLQAALLAEVAKADRKVVDPEAALQLLDRSTLELDDDGLPTNTAQAVDSLLEKRPFLVATSGGAARGQADQGARQSGTDQMTEAELQSLNKAGDIAAIDKAHREGRLRDVLRPT